MRGYRLLKESNRLNQISKTREVLTEQRLNLTSKDFSPYLMGAGHSSSEIILRQYLLLRIGGLNLNQALLFSLGKRSGKVIYPLPKEWRVTISQHGFKVANIRSSFLWQLYIIGGLALWRIPDIQNFLI
jgi:polysaccharide biosynthesis PFTS motif protein